MAKHLVRGEKVLIGEVGAVQRPLLIQLSYDTDLGDHLDIDIFVFVEDGSGRVEKQNVLFYGNPEAFGGGLIHETGDPDRTRQKAVRLDLTKLPEDTMKVHIGAAVYKESCVEKSGAPEEVVHLMLTLRDLLLQETLFDFEVSVTPKLDESLLVGEIYKYSGSWKFHAQGLSGSGPLTALVRKLCGISFK